MVKVFSLRVAAATVYVVAIGLLLFYALRLAGQQRDDMLVSHIFMWTGTGVAALAGVIIVWSAPKSFEAVSFWLIVCNALINLIATAIIGIHSVLAQYSYGAGLIAFFAIPVLLVTFAVRRKRAG